MNWSKPEALNEGEFMCFQQAGSDWNGLEWDGMFPNKTKWWEQNGKWAMMGWIGTEWSAWWGWVLWLFKPLLVTLDRHTHCLTHTYTLLTLTKHYNRDVTKTNILFHSNTQDVTKTNWREKRKQHQYRNTKTDNSKTHADGGWTVTHKTHLTVYGS